ncbi:hypothetical protein Dip518_000065 [Parelusimicrobium proximum]|uniref:hypothetical protein n=1 Tax=Parelusimicrobium proximum TaxID=3228953 RepID=UPI003D17E1DF
MKKIIILTAVLYFAGCSTVPREGTWRAESYKEKQEIEIYYNNLPSSLIDFNDGSLYDHFVRDSMQTFLKEEKVKFVNSLNRVYMNSKNYDEWKENAKKEIGAMTRTFVFAKGVALSVSMIICPKNESFKELRVKESVSELTDVMNFLYSEKINRGPVEYLGEIKRKMNDNFNKDRALHEEHCS